MTKKIVEFDKIVSRTEGTYVRTNYSRQGRIVHSEVEPFRDCGVGWIEDIKQSPFGRQIVNDNGIIVMDPDTDEVLEVRR